VASEGGVVRLDVEREVLGEAVAARHKQSTRGTRISGDATDHITYTVGGWVVNGQVSHKYAHRNRHVWSRRRGTRER
jgi:hypothetical protein